MKKTVVILNLLFFLSGCAVSKKKYEALKAELTQLKADLKDEDRDGVPNYLDLELQTNTLAKVDSHGRAIRIEKVVDIDEDGILDVYDFCPTIKGVAAANGCPDMDGDGIYDFLDKCPYEFGFRKEEGCPHDSMKVIERHDHLTPPEIRFQGRTNQFTSKTAKLLDSLTPILVNFFEIQKQNILQISSYTDSIGDSLKSILFTKKRGEFFKDYLVKKGIPSDQIEIIAVGSKSPRYPNNTKEGRKANNRIECTIQLKQE